MKILMLTPYLTLASRPEFSRNKTGFGYMVYDIANNIGKIAQVDVLASDSIGNAFNDNNIHFLRRSYWDIIRCLFNCVSPSLLFSMLKHYKMEKGTALRFIYYWLLTGYYSKVIKYGGYDVVHIHGCNFSNELWMQVCEKQKVKYLITLHALNSFSDTVLLEPAGKQYERDFFLRVNAGIVNVSVISTGMKRKIESLNNNKECANIAVVCNSYKDTSIDSNNYLLDVRKAYNIPQKSHILLYAGNISENKNQKQLVESFDLMPQSLCEETYVLFCGKDNTENHSFKETVVKSKYAHHLIICGPIEREQMHAYFSAADAVVLLSFAEGFGLSLVEGMSFGKPCLAFSDIDAYDDIYNPCAMVGVHIRDNYEVAKGLETLLIQTWDANAIKHYSQKFNSSQMAQNYVSLYKTIYRL